ncbi:hydroxymethylglutaryl-CoA lyase [Sphingobacterium sp. UT-1RO-CII-1]|uniref:hydroxymethylglutaryl-CoA lyase n=1 Tax=Sphingobacterium sp. UT-1RO-CII-1 TaxID=2995225 RepID=UPI00227AC734|nr:hydroxymethylglutaryl-CoA lyase [Sphingobacterium sp. UT-1RO-CII-1]MCY4778718.1 hydroxymethylglutaryl-CoA lyase [Sphingobacterium sp. UT-1RO-CII-1]
MHNKEKIRLVDCPRDAIQGIHTFIPTYKKIEHINNLINSDLFDYVDFGSFVSPKVVPQLRDTEEVLESIIDKRNTELIAIIANEKGVEIGSKYAKIDYLGYPFSISDTFQKRNTNRSIDGAFETVRNCQDILSGKTHTKLMIYISMAFGNPYGDDWHPDMVTSWIEKLIGEGVSKFSLADTTSEATVKQIELVFNSVKKSFPTIELSIHLHSRIDNAANKIEAAYMSGCRIFEGALMGYGGCPFAKDDLVGNIPTELLLERYKQPEELSIVPDLLKSFQKLISNDV